MLAKTLLVVLSSAASVALAVNPVGSGSWTPTSPGFSVQQCAGGSVNGNEFKLPTSPNGSTSGSGCSNGHLRAERRYNNDYSNGVHQFGGQFKINSFKGNNIVLKQTFNGDNGPYFILAVKNNGDLYSAEGSTTIASGVADVGKTITINTIHDTGKRSYKVYVNGALKYTDSQAPGGSFYDKFGTYTTNSGSGPIDVTWSNTQFWTQ